MHSVRSPQPASPKTLEFFSRLQQANARVAATDARPNHSAAQVGVPVTIALLLGFAVLLVAGMASPENAIIVVPILVALMAGAFIAAPFVISRRSDRTEVPVLRPPYSTVEWEKVSKETWDNHGRQVFDALFEDPLEREEFLYDLRGCASAARIIVDSDTVSADMLVAATVEDVRVVFMGTPDGARRPEPCRWDGITFFSESRPR